MIDHQENPNIELTRGGGGRIKEVEEHLLDDGFRGTGEGTTTARLRVQEEIFQKTSAVLFDKVSILIMSDLFVVMFSYSHLFG